MVEEYYAQIEMLQEGKQTDFWQYLTANLQHQGAALALVLEEAAAKAKSEAEILTLKEYGVKLKSIRNFLRLPDAIIEDLRKAIKEEEENSERPSDSDGTDVTAPRY